MSSLQECSSLKLAYCRDKMIAMKMIVQRSTGDKLEIILINLENYMEGNWRVMLIWCLQDSCLIEFIGISWYRRWKVREDNLLEEWVQELILSMLVKLKNHSREVLLLVVVEILHPLVCILDLQIILKIGKISSYKNLLLGNRNSNIPLVYILLLIYNNNNLDHRPTILKNKIASINLYLNPDLK